MSDINKTPILIDVPMPVLTPRLMIRPPQAGDSVAMSAMKRASWHDLKAWMGWAVGDGPDEMQDEMILREKAAEFILRKDMQLLAFDRAAGHLVASVGLHRFDWHARRFEIGYWVGSPFTGTGIATEASVGLARFAFNALAAKRVEIRMDPRNGASEAVAKRAGFTYEATLHKDCVGTDGSLRDTHIYVAHDDSVLPKLDVSWGRSL
jgi:RimJ/RimL family protein N-acetyltransferase